MDNYNNFDEYDKVFDDVFEVLDKYEDQSNVELLTYIQSELIDELSEFQEGVHGYDTRRSVQKVKVLTTTLLQFLIEKETGQRG